MGVSKREPETGAEGPPPPPLPLQREVSGAVWPGWCSAGLLRPSSPPRAVIPVRSSAGSGWKMGEGAQQPCVFPLTRKRNPPSSPLLTNALSPNTISTRPPAWLLPAACRGRQGLVPA
ncbi:hypothetical protein AAFF_G00286750 [Aldrovandia affinis]|uniref:Uncharacterized protein n=1 Tax=Aldrovandia affinis TaxID=143900 RepID=A0AAD7X269_9TELE|nr:hypothetical protein AAFF_G00286750 [Aldrovandia affinis]